MPSVPLEPTLDEIEIREVLEGLSSTHPLVIVTDRKGRLCWLNDALRELCGGAERYMGADLKGLLPRMLSRGAIHSVKDRLLRNKHIENLRLDLSRLGDGWPTVFLNVFRAEGPDSGSQIFVGIVRSPEGQPGRAEGTDYPHSHAILDSATDAVVATDRDGFITYANPVVHDLLGLHPEQLVDRPIGFLIQRWAELGEAMAGAPLDQDIELERADGRRVWISVSSRELRDRDAHAVGHVSFLRDVTERHDIHRELEEKNSELESYVHTVSHDLRSPLVSLLGFTRLLRDDYGATLDETGRHFIERIAQAGHTMEALVQDLLELAGIGESRESRSLIDPRSVLLQVQAELKPQIEDAGIQLLLPASPPMVFCDRTRLYQIFSNLIGNAIRHMGPCDDPRVEVCVSEEAEAFRIQVRDNGKGIAREHHERVFQLFQTLEGPSRATRSTGVGLAIVKKIAESCDGRIRLESSPGSGCAFDLTLAKPQATR